MADGDRGVDFVTIDGGEGGTGASPLIFADAVSLPFRLGFARVYASSPRRGLHEDVTFIGAGKLGLPDNAVVAFALGVDMVNVAREAMLAVGCIQAQKCHTDECPTGVATQNPWLARGLDPELQGGARGQLRQDAAARPAQGLRGLRRRAPRPDRARRRGDPRRPQRRPARSTRSTATRPGWGYPSERRPARISRIMAATEEEEAETEGPPETCGGRRPRRRRRRRAAEPVTGQVERMATTSANASRAARTGPSGSTPSSALASAARATT